MSFPRRKMDELDVNLTPLIDVVFLLLIFFMVSTTFTKETRLGLELPEAAGESSVSAIDVVEVTISADGTYAVNGSSLKESSAKYLEAKIVEASSGSNSLPFIIAADAHAKHQAVVTVMETAGRLGFVNLSISTKTPADENK